MQLGATPQCGNSQNFTKILREIEFLASSFHENFRHVTMAELKAFKIINSMVHNLKKQFGPVWVSRLENLFRGLFSMDFSPNLLLLDQMGQTCANLRKDMKLYHF